MKFIAILVVVFVIPATYMLLFGYALSQGIFYGQALIGASFLMGAAPCWVGIIDCYRFFTNHPDDEDLAQVFLRDSVFAHALPIVATVAALVACLLGGIDPPWPAPLVMMGTYAYFGWQRLTMREEKQNAKDGFETKHVRGPKLETVDEVRERQASSTRGINFGGVTVPTHPVQHFAVVGMTRSGKTTMMKLLMESVLPNVLTERDARALVYDPKRNFLPFLTALGLRKKTIILHPHDARSTAWDIASDVDGTDIAQTVAAVMVKGNTQGTNAHFVNAPRAILKSVFISLNERTRDRRWTLRDVILVLRDETLLHRLFERTKGQEFIIPKYLKTREASSVLSSLEEHVGKYETIAAAWQDCGANKISLREWLRSNSVLLLGQGGSSSEAVNDINQLIMQRITQLMQSELTESKTRRSYFFLDELRFAGRLATLNELFALAGGMGTQMFVAFQDFRGLVDVYDENKAAEILGQCSNYAFYKLNEKMTKEFAAEKLGKQQREEWTVTESQDRENKNEWTKSRNQSLEEHELVTPDEFASIPLPNTSTGLDGYYVTDDGRFASHISSTTFEKLDAMTRGISEEAFIPRRETKLRPFDDDDLDRLGLSEQPKSPPGPKGTSTAKGTSSVLDEVQRVRRNKTLGE